jgi:citronellol/citronellal dehydrogenase
MHTAITGASSGIGAALARELARAGHKLTLVARRRELLDALVAELGDHARSVAHDLADPTRAGDWLGAAEEAFGAIDVLVNNAGGQFEAPAEEISLKGWRAVHRLAVDAVWDLTRTVAVRSMIPNRRGVVVFVGFSPRRGIPGMVHASSARAAVENLAGGLATEWSRYGIRSVCVAPGYILTEGLEGYGADAVARWERHVPLGRLGRPEEVAAVVAFLASDGGAYVTGTTVVVDGGVDAWGLGEPPPRATR